MTLYVSAPKPTAKGLITRGEFDVNLVAYAIIAGILLYFIKKSFVNNLPPYASIIIGMILTIYLFNYAPFHFIGVTLMADGIYKLLTEYVSISS